MWASKILSRHKTWLCKFLFICLLRSPEDVKASSMIGKAANPRYQGRRLYSYLFHSLGMSSIVMVVDWYCLSVVHYRIKPTEVMSIPSQLRICAVHWPKFLVSFQTFCLQYLFNTPWFALIEEKVYTPTCDTNVTDFKRHQSCSMKFWLEQVKYPYFENISRRIKLCQRHNIRSADSPWVCSEVCDWVGGRTNENVYSNATRFDIIPELPCSWVILHRVTDCRK